MKEHVHELTPAKVTEAYKRGLEKNVRDKARGHTEEALETLVAIMRNKKSPANTRRQCAMDILAQGWGRPDSRDEAPDRRSQGVTIVINKLSTGEMTRVAAREIAADVVEAQETLELLDRGDSPPS